MHSDIHPKLPGNRSLGILFDSLLALPWPEGRDLKRRSGDFWDFVGDEGAEVDGSFESISISRGLGISKWGTGAFAPVLLDQVFCLSISGGAEILGGSRELIELWKQKRKRKYLD